MMHQACSSLRRAVKLTAKPQLAIYRRFEGAAIESLFESYVCWLPGGPMPPKCRDKQIGRSPCSTAPLPVTRRSLSIPLGHAGILLSRSCKGFVLIRTKPQGNCLPTGRLAEVDVSTPLFWISYRHARPRVSSSADPEWLGQPTTVSMPPSQRDQSAPASFRVVLRRRVRFR